MERRRFGCDDSATSIWNVIREMPPNASLWRRIFSVTSSGLPTSSAPSSLSKASKCARVAESASESELCYHPRAQH